MLRFKIEVITLCAVIGVACAAGRAAPAQAQSTIWDSTISNTNWYVPTAQLLAYMSPKAGFLNPIPIGDQTLWTLGTATNGAFTGTSVAQLRIGPALLTDTSTIQGFVTTSGQITMLFTPIGGGTVTVGLGTMRTVNGVSSMEMQMITGDSLLVTHWAYMLPYDPATFTPPPSAPVPANSVPQWAWTAGTPWRIVSPTLFGTQAPGRFVITDYQNGYFWGAGLAPGGSTGAGFTLLGSVTPEGRVLFNTLSRGNLTSLYGAASGDASQAQMVTSSYDLTGKLTGGAATMSLIQPYAETLRAQGGRVGLEAAEVLYRLSATSLGWSGSMAPGFAALDNLSGPALATAVKQTLPVLTGAAAQAAYVTQRAFGQTMMDRLDDVGGVGAASGRAVWIQPLGVAARQAGRDGVPGYNASGGGVAFGADAALSRRALIGGTFAVSRQAITGSDDAVPNRLGVASYQLGLYGAYVISRDVTLDYQFDGGLNDNGESRSLNFMGTSAGGSYRSYTGHAGAGLKTHVPLQGGLALIPSLHLDYGTVRSGSYRESGAGGFSLNVDPQTYQELIATAGMKAVYQLAKQVHLTGDIGAGYNALNQRLQIGAAFSGGGERFATNGLGLSPWIYSAGFGLVAAGNDRLDVSVRYGINATSSGLLQQSGHAVLKIRL
ncbi:autotransporter outer membrane beta-barrel domain-containing protein [Bradyrhizobium ontarionense]|uniref:Autotransporter outer membrane beta-barrel domain-containing protein n=1 Tax=Bradyrhizobium ontarionense TaxID=2898149 RepID=A0ABY3R4K6_9BRAD|nr:autotransporter outer membrane beta-barrel domain-containing protein [Bradyrhizobium sp. A19]UFZ02230.1 autotransporter outer membrane beta-barrel domain-containing protein [Bradyrhizobium sp. A19]